MLIVFSLPHPHKRKQRGQHSLAKGPWQCCSQAVDSSFSSTVPSHYSTRPSNTDHVLMQTYHMPCLVSSEHFKTEICNTTLHNIQNILTQKSINMRQTAPNARRENIKNCCVIQRNQLLLIRLTGISQRRKECRKWTLTAHAGRHTYVSVSFCFSCVMGVQVVVAVSIPSLLHKVCPVDELHWYPQSVSARQDCRTHPRFTDENKHLSKIPRYSTCM